MMRAAACPSRSCDFFFYLFLVLHQIVPLKKAILRSSSVQDKTIKNDIPNVNNNRKQLALAACEYQIILRRPSLVVIDVGLLRKARGHFLKRSTWRITYRLAFILVFGWTTIFALKNWRQVGSLSMADPKRGLWEGLNFKEVPKFWKLIGFRLLTT